MATAPRKAHSEADEEHNDIFLPFLERFATGEKEQITLQAVRESFDLFAIYRRGVAVTMERLPA
ncbi:MAG: hypothetical protein ACREP8_14930 [Candidatus Binatia bacterium]